MHSYDPESLMGFCHLERTGGTSLIHVLRRIFHLRYADVRPLSARNDAIVTNRDISSYYRMNPFLRCVYGHAIAPWTEIAGANGPLTYVTLLREPISRTLSHYRYWATHQYKDLKIEKFLVHREASNMQVRKISGTVDVDSAKEILSDKFLLVGTVEHFDEFLVLLADKLKISVDKLWYSKKNVGAASVQSRDSSKSALEEIEGRNDADKRLYEWVRNDLRKIYMSTYSGDLQSDLATLRAANAKPQTEPVRQGMDFMYRNGYIKPLTGLIRLSNGLSYHGSYVND